MSQSQDGIQKVNWVFDGKMDWCPNLGSFIVQEMLYGLK